MSARNPKAPTAIRPPAAGLAARIARRTAAQLAAALCTLVAQAAPAGGNADAVPTVHFAPLAPGSGGATPWPLNPAWFTLLALGIPATLWAGLAWKRALDEDPHRLRRAGSRELRRLLARMRRAGGPQRLAHLHAWCQATARTWGVRVSTPTKGQVARSMQVLAADAKEQAHWLELWTSAERALYGDRQATPANWLEEVASAARQVKVPPRQNWLPNRKHHWLPKLAASVYALALLAGAIGASRAAPAPAQHPSAASAAPASAIPAPDARTAAALAAAQRSAGQALRVNWNDWAAHYDVAAQQILLGNWSYAVAHFSAAFLQHPSSTLVRDNLRYCLQQAGTMDPTLRRLLYGAWFQRYPALLSPAGWQHLALFAALLTGAGLCALVVPLYHTHRSRELRIGGRWAISVGAATLTVCVLAWNAWGALHSPDVAMLVEGVNLSPVPTDLVTEQETTPVSPGALAQYEKVFLSWRRVRIIGVPGVGSGWTRASSVMPLYR